MNIPSFNEKEIFLLYFGKLTFIQVENSIGTEQEMNKETINRVKYNCFLSTNQLLAHRPPFSFANSVNFNDRGKAFNSSLKIIDFPIVQLLHSTFTIFINGP